MTPLMPWDPLAAEVVVDNPWVRLRRDTVRLPSGRVVDDFFVTEQPDVVLVFALTGAGQVVVVRQWRQGRGGFYRELPGGLLDPGELPADAAARELLEETGYACGELRELGRFGMDPTRTTSAIVAFLGLAARVESAPVADEQEEIEVDLVPVDELLPLIRAGEISSAGTVATVYRALDELGRRPRA
jgi:8-oxo-dGTP pyrophosphatase MutT (NUDIX family)